MSLNSFTRGTESCITQKDVVTKHILADGARYTGEVITKQKVQRPSNNIVEEKVPQGKGKILWPSGDKYKGYFYDGIPTGKGEKTFADRSVLKCIFRNGVATGYGKLTIPGENGLVYEGTFVNDKPDGEGEEESNSGSSFYKGQYKNGKKGPKGYMRFGDGNVYEGEFKDNAIQGKGKITNNIKKIEYEGEWRMNKMHGYGVYKWQDGRRYQGEYLDDKKHGFGAYMWADGRVYYGMWKDG